MDRRKPVTLQTCGRRRICSEFVDGSRSVLTVDPPPRRATTVSPLHARAHKPERGFFAATAVDGAGVLTDTIL
jgi:hypothetical protein